jgi:hypothetical protein
LIQYKTASAFMKENWPSGKWSIFKGIVRYKGINVSKSPFRFCFVNFSFFLSQSHVFLVQVFVKIESNRIVSKIEKVIRFDLDTIWFHLSKNIRFDNKIWFDLTALAQTSSLHSTIIIF